VASGTVELGVLIVWRSTETMERWAVLKHFQKVTSKALF